MSIANRINEITKHLENDYTNIEALVGEVSVDKNIENIAPILDGLWESLPHTTGTGTDLSLSTKSGKAKVLENGNTSQATNTTGEKNLYIGSEDFSGEWTNSSYWQTDSSTFNNCVVKKNNGSWNGLYKTFSMSSGETYTYSIYAKADENRTAGLYLDNSVTPKSVDINLTTEWTRYSITFTADYNTNNLRPRLENKTSSATNYTYIACPQLVEGNLTDYFPYNASPNPSYPQTIHSVSGNNTIEVWGANYFNYDYAKDYSNTILNAYRFVEIKNVKPNTRYTIYNYTSPPSETYPNVYLSTSASYSGISFTNLTAVSYTDILTSADGKLYLCGYYSTWTEEQWTDFISYFKNAMVIEGTDRTTPYSKYSSVSYPLNLPVGMELNSISTYKDGFIINSGKNLFDIQSIVKGRLDNGVIGYESATTSLTLNDTSFSFTTNATWRGVSTEDYIEVKPSTDYVLKIATTSTTGVVMACYDENKTWLSNATQTTIETGTTKFTTPASTKYARISIQLSTTGTCNIDIPQLTESSTALPYEPYGSGEWYLKKHIGKYTFTGSADEKWSASSSYPGSFYGGLKTANPTIRFSQLYCSHFARASVNSQPEISSNYQYKTCFIENDDGQMDFWWNNGLISIDDWRNWLSANNLNVYYPLPTPTYTKITDTTLLNQLNAVYRAYTYNTQTNFTQINNDLPFNLDVTALGE